MKRFLAAHTVFLLILSVCFCKGATGTAQGNTFEAVCIDYDTSEELSRVSINTQNISYGGENIMLISRSGKGAINGFKDASWLSESRLKEGDNGFLTLLGSSMHIFDKAGKTLAIYEKSFDYKNMVIKWSRVGEKGKIIKKAQFPLKGKTCDDASLLFFLKPFAQNKPSKSKQSFYLLTNEPRLYKTNIRFLGTERVKLPSGRVSATKIKLTGDMGVPEKVIDKLVPPTFVWFQKKSPHEWVKYQGFEKGSGSNYVLLERIISRQGK